MGFNEMQSLLNVRKHNHLYSYGSCFQIYGPFKLAGMFITCHLYTIGGRIESCSFIFILSKSLQGHDSAELSMVGCKLFFPRSPSVHLSHSD